MSTQFVDVNGSMLDRKEHEKEVFLLKKLVEYEFQQAIMKYGFRKNGDRYINKKLGMSFTIKLTINYRPA